MFERGKKDKLDTGAGDTSRDAYDLGPGSANPDIAPRSAESGRSDVAVIGRSIRINGDLQGEEDLRIEGDVTGTVQLRNNTLTIGSEGKISANVYAKAVTVDGLMEGDIYGSERVSIRRNAQVHGNITAPRVSLDDGARFKGSIEMDPAAVEKALGIAGNSASKIIDASARASAKSNGGPGGAKAVAQGTKAEERDQSRG